MLIGQYIDRKWIGLTVEDYLKTLDCRGLVFRLQNECLFYLSYEKQTQNMCQSGTEEFEPLENRKEK